MTRLFYFLLISLCCACSSSTNSNQGTAPKPETISTDHSILGEENARKQLNDCLKGKGQPFTWDTLIKTPATAIAIAEPILFDVFGKEQILQEKPYEIYQMEGYWYIAGTLPKSYNKGGAFEIIFSAKDGRIIRLTHYK
ncbi:NTF2 fold immunity protein [Segetibacter aerophilus]|uniref:NTF2 fold domain-containing protein n=1 Tax=Segetibacter aerophilus TaxID=670293 RepID=A0A512BGM9_9BACT|nr:NTF2 fold immunity protein [Segetibacter aerophilus]GEO11108.1 hypothetical protein SAE01_36040 [Segetibacter aerophilus]